MNLTAIAIRCLFAYAFLLLITRVSGKRTIRQVTPIDFAASIMLGDLVDDLLWAEVPAAQFVVAVGTLLTVAVLVTVATTCNPQLNRLLHGSPTQVISAGEVVEAALRKERMSQQDLMALLRQHGVADLREVESATVEPDGQLGLCWRPWAQKAQKQDLVRLRQRAGESRG